MKVRALVLILLLLVLGGCGRPPGSLPAGTYVFVVVDEASSHALEAAPVNDQRLPAYSANFQTRAIVVGHAALAPGRRTQALIGYHARGSGVTLSQQVFPLNRLPWTLRLTDPLRLEGEVSDAQGRSLGVLNVINNAERLIPFDLCFLEVGGGGTLRLLAGEEEVTLDPGESWLLAFIDAGGEVRAVPWGDGWEAAVREAIDRDQRVTRLEVTNHGLWEKQQVQVGIR